MKVGDLVVALSPRVSVRSPTLGWRTGHWHDASCEKIGLVVSQPIENEYTTLVLFGEQLYYILPKDFRVLSNV